MSQSRQACPVSPIVTECQDSIARFVSVSWKTVSPASRPALVGDGVYAVWYPVWWGTGWWYLVGGYWVHRVLGTTHHLHPVPPAPCTRSLYHCTLYRSLYHCTLSHCPGYCTPCPTVPDTLGPCTHCTGHPWTLYPPLRTRLITLLAAIVPYHGQRLPQPRECCSKRLSVPASLRNFDHLI